MAIIRLRRDTAANWTTQNPVLALGEPGVETDTQKIKIGDGSTAWSSLPYTASSGTGAGVTSYNDLTDKPTIPASLGDFGITAGLDGQVLTLNSSLVPVWATPSSGNPFDQSLNTDDIVTFDLLTVTDSAGIKNFYGERITNTYVNGTMYVGGSSTQTPVSILMGGAGPRNEWAFTPDGKLTFPRNTDQVTTTDPVLTIKGGEFPEIASTDSSLTGPANLAIVANDLNISGYTGSKVIIHADSGSVAADGNLVLTSGNASVAKNWTFNTDGSLIPPTATIPALAWQDSFTHPTLELGTNTDGVAISDTVSDDINRGGRHIRIIGQKGYGTYSSSGNGGKGTSIDIYGGLGGESAEWNMGGEGGTINIQGGTGQHGGLGGWVNITGGKATENNAGNSPATVYGGQVNITGGAAIDGLAPSQGIGGDVVLQGGQGNQLNGRVSVQTYDSVNTSWNIWHFRPDNTLELPSSSSVQQNSSWTRTVDTSVSDTGIIWTAIQSNVSSVKLTIQLEVEETGDSTGWHSQIADAVIASRGFATSFSGPGGEPAMTVFGVTHTSIQPLAIFSVQRNPLTKNIEVVATKTAAGNSGSVMYFKIHSVEMATRN